MRLRDQHIRKVRIDRRRHGWLVQPHTAIDGEKLTQIVDTFAEAANIAIPPTMSNSVDMIEIDGRTYLQFNCTVYGPDLTPGSHFITVGPLADGLPPEPVAVP